MRRRSPGAFARRLSGCLLGRCAVRLRKRIHFACERRFLPRSSPAGSGPLVAGHWQVHAPRQGSTRRSRESRGANQTHRRRLRGHKVSRRARLAQSRSPPPGRRSDPHIRCRRSAMLRAGEKIEPGAPTAVVDAAPAFRPAAFLGADFPSPWVYLLAAKPAALGRRNNSAFRARTAIDAKGGPSRVFGGRNFGIYVETPFFVRARLQPCRNCRKWNAALAAEAPCLRLPPGTSAPS
jgi:hypothetical protein